MAQPTPGWYYADGDPPNTVRYWDGELWQGEPQPSGVPAAPPPPAPGPPGAPPPPGYQQPGYQQPGYQQPGYQQPGYQQPYAYRSYSEASQATTALVLGIVGLVCCGLCGPFAWKIGHDEIVAIDAGRRDPTNRGTAMGGKVTGIIATGFLVLGLVWILFFVVLAAGSSS